MGNDQNPNLIFVYGLLKTGGEGYDALGLASRTRSQGPARISGQIFDLGDYPGLVTGGPDLVHGELFELSTAELIEILDAYELCNPDDPAGSEYRRIIVELLDDGRRAWTYEYNRPVDQYPLITSGNWLID